MSTGQSDSATPANNAAWGSPLLAHVALVALVLFSIGQALHIFEPLVRANSRQQVVVSIGPGSNITLQDLGKYLSEGWRITHVSNAIAAAGNQSFGSTVYVLER